jgi:ketosteroid isomerase-like protein
MMNRRILLLGIPTLIAGAAGRLRARERSPGQSKPAAVGEAERAFAASMAARDIKAFAARLADEAIFVGGATGPVLRGKAAIVDGWRKFFEGPIAPFSWEPDLVEVLESGTLALSSGPVRDPAGTVIGRFNSVWRLDDDAAWRVVFDKGSPVCPK